MSEIIRKYLAQLTLLSALAGGVVALPLRDRVSHSTNPMTQQELRRELDLGTSMPLIALSNEFASRYGQAPAFSDAAVRLQAAGHPRLFIPDKYAMAAMNCETTETAFQPLIQKFGGVWFKGSASSAPHIVQSGTDTVSGMASFEGSVYRCQGGHAMLAASGVKLEVPLENVGSGRIEVRSSHAWISYPASAADLFISFLLMIFIPTLTLSIAKAIVDSAQSGGGTADLFRSAFKYFGATTLLAGFIGVTAGYICYQLRQPETDLHEIAAVTLGSKPVPTEYDPHPILTQLTNIIPANPLGALSNPDGNKGLQVAFTAVMIGLLLAVIGDAQRARVSQFLKNALALVVKDSDLQWRSLSDWADLLTPAGVFLISMTFCGTVTLETLGQLLNFILCTFGALFVHAAVLMTWIVSRRDWKEWFQKALLPGVPGLVTALATASSYAALPAIARVELLAGNASRRGIFDLCTTINKNGTTIYISVMAAYVLFDHGRGAMDPLILVVLLLSGLASVATAGLPFAAVFGLRMVLLASGSAGGLAWVIVPLDPLVDRFVTALNVFSNLAACSAPRKGAAAANPMDTQWESAPAVGD